MKKDKKRDGPSPLVRNVGILVSSIYMALGFSPALTFLQLYQTKRVGLFRLVPESLSDNLTKTFSDWVVGESAVKEGLRERVGVHATLFGTSETWRLIVSQTLTITAYVILFLLFVRYSHWLRHYPFASPGIAAAIWESSIQLVLALIVPSVILRTLAQYFMQRSISRPNFAALIYRVTLANKLAQWWPIAFGVILFVWWAILEILSRQSPLTPNRQVKYVALPFTLVVILTGRLISIAGNLINYLFNRERAQYADSMITVQLLLLVNLLKNPSGLPESLRRRLSIGVLETISQLFEYSLPKQIVGTDHNSASLSEKLARIANGVRALKGRVAIPHSASWDVELLKSVSDFLLNFLSLNWAALPTVEKRDTPRTTVMTRSKAAARWLIAAAMPGVLVAILQLTPLRLTGQRSEIALLVTLGWFALSVLLRLDPEFSAKTKMLKDVQDISKFGLKT